MKSLEIQPYLISTKKREEIKKQENLTKRTNRERKIPGIQEYLQIARGEKGIQQEEDTV